MDVEVVVPWRGGCEHRERAFEWLQWRLPWPVTACEPPTGVWSKGAAIWAGAVRSSADVIVAHDADVWTDGLERAIGEVEAGEPWAQPHLRVYRLTENATRDVLAGHPPDLKDLARQSYEGKWGGGVLVVPRETVLAVPMDPRFVGWGGEDISWANALWFLAGPAWHGTADLVHLWHPGQPRNVALRYGSFENEALAGRYKRARFRPNEMRLLVNEALEVLRELDGVDEQTVSAGAQV